MSVTIFRWHAKTCPHKDKGRDGGRTDRCTCWLWADGQPLKKPMSLHTRDRVEALKKARDIELDGVAPARPPAALVKGPLTIAAGRETFFGTVHFRGLKKPTQYKHEILWRQLTAFAAANKIENVEDLDADTIEKFIKTWSDGVRGADGEWVKEPEGQDAVAKKMERFRQFFKLAVNRDWMLKSPMRGMKGPSVPPKQTPPLSVAEMMAILAYVDKQVREARPDALDNWRRVKSLILFMRFSGLRISDAVGCQIAWVKKDGDGGRVGLFARKTEKYQKWIDVSLPPDVFQALAETPRMSDLYWFWTGASELETATKHWQAKLAEIFAGAGIVKRSSNCVSHRFRDTFAVAMLETGKTLQDVADALGNTLAVTQAAYNPWSKTRQDRLDAAVRDAWDNDAVLATLGKKPAGVVSIAGARKRRHG